MGIEPVVDFILVKDSSPDKSTSINLKVSSKKKKDLLSTEFSI